MQLSLRLLAISAFVLPASARAQSALAYDVSISETTDRQPATSIGHALVSGHNVRIDLKGMSSLSRVGPTSLGDSSTIISADTGMAHTVSILGHRDQTYVQFQPLMLAEKMKQMTGAMGTPSLDFTGSAVKLDSIGPGPQIAGYNTIHYRLAITMQIAMNGMSMGKQDQTSDIYIAPDLKEFTDGGALFSEASDAVGGVPGIPKSFTDDIAAATKRLSSGLAVRTETKAESAMMGTGTSHTLTVEVSNVKKVTAPAGSFVVPANYKRIVPPGMEALM